MGKALLVLGVGLGLFGVGWSFLTLGALVLVAGLGGAPDILLISALGFAGSVAAVAGGVVSVRWDQAGAAVILGAGAVALVGLPIVQLLHPELALTAVEFLTLSFVLGWWAYGLVAGGAAALVVARRRGAA